MLVANLMTPNPASVRSDETLAAAAQIMWDRDCGTVPVIEPGSGRVFGMLTDRDICMATWSRGAAPDAIRVADVVSPSLVSCQPEDTLDHAEAAMRSSQVRRVPVVDSQQRLVGILSLADIARAAAKHAPPSNGDGLSTDGLVSTLAGICVRHASKGEELLQIGR